VKPGDVVYVLLRWYGAQWYEDLNLPNKDLVDYVVEFQYTVFNAKKTTIGARCEVMNETWPYQKHHWIKLYGRHLILEPEMQLIDADFIQSHPNLKANSA
jgi:hypothetical protein